MKCKQWVDMEITIQENRVDKVFISPLETKTCPNCGTKEQRQIKRYGEEINTGEKIYGGGQGKTI